MFNLTPWRSKEREGGTAVGPRREQHPLFQLRNEFDNLFNRFFGNWPTPFAGDMGDLNTGFEMEDTDKEVIIRAEAPGFEAEDFDVQIAGNLLTVKAHHKQESKETKGEYQFAERHLERSVTLPAGADPNQVEARYHSGVLELRIARSPEAQAKRIEVKPETEKRMEVKPETEKPQA
jgi:HSP20 family protein